MEDIHFVPSEPALILKELGFDEPCLIKDTDQGEDCAIYYVHSKGRPTFSQAFKWFREKHKIHSFIDCKWKNIGWEYELVDLNKMEKISCIGNYGYKTPEEAELECLKKLIEIVKNGKEHTDS
jgi:hypothetical protein